MMSDTVFSALIIANFTMMSMKFNPLIEDFYKNMSIGLIIESEHIDKKIDDILNEFKYTFYIYFLLPILILTFLVFIFVTG